MYDNIGGKIKNLAKGIFIVMTILAVIGGIVCMSIDEDLIVIGLVIMVVAPLLFWIASWMLYGYGELIENSSIIAKAMKEPPRSVAPAPKTISDPLAPPAPNQERIARIENLRASGLITEEMIKMIQNRNSFDAHTIRNDACLLYDEASVVKKQLSCFETLLSKKF